MLILSNANAKYIMVVLMLRIFSWVYTYHLQNGIGSSVPMIFLFLFETRQLSTKMLILLESFYYPFSVTSLMKN